MANVLPRLGPLRGALAPIAGSSDFKAVVAGSTDFDTVLAAGDWAVFTCDVDCYIEQGDTPTAAASDGSMFVPAGLPILIDGSQGDTLAVARKATDGVATLQMMTLVIVGGV